MHMFRITFNHLKTEENFWEIQAHHIMSWTNSFLKLNSNKKIMNFCNFAKSCSSWWFLEAQVFKQLPQQAVLLPLAYLLRAQSYIDFSIMIDMQLINQDRMIMQMLLHCPYWKILMKMRYWNEIPLTSIGQLDRRRKMKNVLLLLCFVFKEKFCLASAYEKSSNRCNTDQFLLKAQRNLICVLFGVSFFLFLIHRLKLFFQHLLLLMRKDLHYLHWLMIVHIQILGGKATNQQIWQQNGLEELRSPFKEPCVLQQIKAQ